MWALFVIYGSCFGMELTIDNIAALYFADYFHLALTAAGFVAASFGMMNLFARALGGIVSDRCNRRWGLRGRVALLGCTILGEGLALILFSQDARAASGHRIDDAGGVVRQDVERRHLLRRSVRQQAALGAVAGIVGAGGNVGAVLAAFLFKTASLTWPQALLILGVTVAADLFTDVYRPVLGVRRACGARGNRGSLAGQLITAKAVAGD